MNMDTKEYEALQRRLQDLKDFKSGQMAQLRAYQEQLKLLKEKSLQEYGVPLEELAAYAEREEQRYNQEMQIFLTDLEEAERIQKEIEAQLASIDG
jgi:hypothetical protein